MKIELSVPYLDVILHSDGTWEEFPRPYTVKRRYPEREAVLLEQAGYTADLVLNEDHTYELTPRPQPTGYSDPSKWIPGFENLYAAEAQERIRQILDRGFLIVEHWKLNAASAPSKIVFDAYGDFVRYLHEKTKPGDDLWIWDWEELLSTDNAALHGKVPDNEGRGYPNGGY